MSHYFFKLIFAVFLSSIDWLQLYSLVLYLFFFSLPVLSDLLIKHINCLQTHTHTRAHSHKRVLRHHRGTPDRGLFGVLCWPLLLACNVMKEIIKTSSSVIALGYVCTCVLLHIRMIVLSWGDHNKAGSLPRRRVDLAPSLDWRPFNLLPLFSC